MKTKPNSVYELIDKDFGGLKTGEITLIGVRPGMGKTSLALHIALNVARDGGNVLFFAAESCAAELELKVIALVSGISIKKIHDWNLTDEEWEIFKNATKMLKKLPIRFIHSDTLDEIKYFCEDTGKVDLIVFDYL